MQIAGDDVSAAGTAAAQKDQPESCAGEDPAEEGGDDPVSAIGKTNQRKKVDESRRQRRRSNRSEQEAKAALDRAPDKERDVEQQHHRSDRRMDQVMEHRRESGHAAGGDVVRRSKKRHRQSV